MHGNGTSARILEAMGENEGSHEAGTGFARKSLKRRKASVMGDILPNGTGKRGQQFKNSKFEENSETQNTAIERRAGTLARISANSINC